jgi:hypothetical protein
MNKKLLSALAVTLIVGLVSGYKWQESRCNVTSNTDISKEEKDVTTITEEIVSPDGTKKTTTTTKDKSKQTNISKEVIKIADKPKVKVNLLAGMSLTDRSMVYGMEISKKVFDQLSVGVWGTSSKEVGISVGYEF